jgi:hypothetical protein
MDAQVDGAALPLGEPLRDDTDTQPILVGAWPGVRVTPEALIYVALAILALILRMAALDHAPLDDAQARQALAALRTVDGRVPGPIPQADSPLTFALNAITFSMANANEVTARLPVALAGVLLALVPALWRRYLGPLPPLIISLLLTISPVMTLAARTMSGVTWTMLLALLGPWLVLRFVETRAERPAILATACFAAMIFLAEPAGFLTAIALGFGVLFAWLTGDESDSSLLSTARRLLRAWPWTTGALAAGVTVVAVATVLFWVPSGLTVVGNTIWTGVRGFVERPTGTPRAFPLWIALRYETGIVLFGLLALYHAVREGGFFERALAGWALAGIVWAVGYAGAGAAHALWITLPLTILVALRVTDWLTERPGILWRVPSWGVPLHALITLGLWLAVGLSVVLLGKRLLFDLPGGVTDLSALVERLVEGIYSRASDFQYQQIQSVEVQPGVFVYAYVLGFIQLRLLITVLVTLLNGVLYFLVGSLWGARAAWRGLALGTLAAVLLFSLGPGGRAAFGPAGDPRRLWVTDPVTDDVFELRETLDTMSLRATGEPKLLTITAQVPLDGALAWALRDYPNTVFVDGVGPEVSSAVVLVPARDEQPRMGAPYVGKDLVIRQAWNIDSLSWRDAIMWFYRDETAIKPEDAGRLRLWVRNDVYGVEQVTED